MLREIKATRQDDPLIFRRWYTDPNMDLFTWHKEGELIAFQLSYNKLSNEFAISWKKSEGFIHNRIDSGEEAINYKMSPVLLADGDFDSQRIAKDFTRASSTIDIDIADFVQQKLLNYPDSV